MSDLGFTHVALSVRNLAESLAFYTRYARMRLVHQRIDTDTGIAVAWITDGTRPFVIVLAQWPEPRDLPLGPFGHLGVGCESREEVDRLCDQARAEGRLRSGPTDTGYPVGYWAYIADPDGNNLEVSHGQEIGLTVERAEPGRLVSSPRRDRARARSLGWAACRAAVFGPPTEFRFAPEFAPA